MRHNHNPVGYSIPLNLWLGIAGVVVGIAVGFLSGAQHTLIGLAIAAVAILAYFFNNFEQAVLGMLVFRSSLDILSDFQIPAAFAIGLDGLTLLYVVLMLLTGQRIKTDKFPLLKTSFLRRMHSVMGDLKLILISVRIDIVRQ